MGKPAIVLTGIGSDLNNGKALTGRAKRKLITQKMDLSLVDVSDNKDSIQNTKSYWNTYHCQNKIHTANGKLYGKYCKNRFCTLCCSIRKADIINRYLPEIKKWEKPYFITLTVKAVPYYSLNAVMRSMIKALKAIIAAYRKRSIRGKGQKLVGIRSLESNFNSNKRRYNPHFHIIVANKEMAEILVSEWLKRSKPGKTSYKAQKMEAVSNNISALIEMVKYGSKIFTEPDLNKKTKAKGGEKIYASALYYIFNAMKGLRIFKRFGFNLPNKEIANTPQFQLLRITRNGILIWVNLIGLTEKEKNLLILIRFRNYSNC